MICWGARCLQVTVPANSAQVTGSEAAIFCSTSALLRQKKKHDLSLKLGAHRSPHKRRLTITEPGAKNRRRCLLFVLQKNIKTVKVSQSLLYGSGFVTKLETREVVWRIFLHLCVKESRSILRAHFSIPFDGLRISRDRWCYRWSTAQQKPQGDRHDLFGQSHPLVWYLTFNIWICWTTAAGGSLIFTIFVETVLNVLFSWLDWWKREAEDFSRAKLCHCTDTALYPFTPVLCFCGIDLGEKKCLLCQIWTIIQGCYWLCCVCTRTCLKNPPTLFSCCFQALCCRWLFKFHFEIILIIWHTSPLCSVNAGPDEYL